MFFYLFAANLIFFFNFQSFGLIQKWNRPSDVSGNPKVRMRKLSSYIDFSAGIQSIDSYIIMIIIDNLNYTNENDNELRYHNKTTVVSIMMAFSIIIKMKIISFFFLIMIIIIEFIFPFLSIYLLNLFTYLLFIFLYI